ncbi:platelet-derived growth factor receptor alpha-like [Montipora capricornis]|uniref:platelet-derived growth factor receptor alpha-like n=1 Tax=Montipora capricornis TaxID=246305 RepID=UPI0035F12470
MDLYVFGTALKLDQINKLRGVPIIVNTTEEVTSGIVVVTWEPPLACPVDKYIVHYREVISLKAKSNWHSVTVNRNETSYMLHLNCRKEYDVAVTSLSGHSESNLSDSKIWNFKTGGGVPEIVNSTKAVPGGTVVVAWKPPLEGACPVITYTVYYRKAAKKSKWQSVTVKGKTDSYTLQLKCKEEYEVALTSLSGFMESTFNESKIWNFKTQGEVPSIPVIKNKETETPRCDVILTWSPSADNGCPLTMYTVNYQRIQPRETEEPWYQVNLTDIMTTNFTISLSCDTLYRIEISAWNELGESERSRPWIIKTLQSASDTSKETSFDKSPESDGVKGLSATQLSALIGGLCALLIIISILIFALRQKAKRRKRLAHNLRPRRSKSTIFALRRWEVLPEQVVFKEEIGRGAFGKVFKATFKESPGIEVFYKPRTQTVDWKEDRIVAVKVLGDTTEEEARNQFLEEIELMKAIGSHRNIVSMLGCCVNSDPIFLVLEYVSYGDLLHWLRNKRIQKSYQKNYSNEKNRLRLAAIKVQFSTEMDDESKQLLTGNEKETMDLSKLNVEAAGKEKEAEEIKPEMKEGVENHLEAQPVHVTQSGCHDNVQREEEFNVKDLLSFAWQIARGMNFLSSNGFVHRDLAARNVLLGEDKVVKISDFGLMRQTHENVYHLKKGKKIPVKWMAPEALYNSEYTTKSDVWSFGILLWELSTMGGNPYPGINNKELYNLLKTGYRMEQPNTCSDKLFELVLTCWKDEPSERPTFESATRSLEEMMQEDAPYLDFESLDESQAYYCSEKLSEDDVTV